LIAVSRTIFKRSPEASTARVLERRKELAVPHAYAPISRIKGWLEGFGEQVDTSREIHALLCEHLDENAATFAGAYDIPLRIFTAEANEDLRRRLLG